MKQNNTQFLVAESTVGLTAMIKCRQYIFQRSSKQSTELLQVKELKEPKQKGTFEGKRH